MLNLNTWGLILAVALAAFGVQASAASLVWSPRTTNNLWNTTATNWAGDRTTFQTGDAVLFGDLPQTEFALVVIAPPQSDLDPALYSVFPTSTTISNESTFYAFNGGSIGFGSLTKLGNGHAALEVNAFSAPHHSFDGGTFVRGGRLSFHMKTGEPSYSLGGGPIEIHGATFNLHVRYSFTRFLNDVRVTSQGGRLTVSRDYDLLPFVGSATLTGNLYLDGPLTLEGWADFEKDQIDGRVIVDQNTVGPRALDFDEPMELSGPIVDGPGQAANPLLLANRSGFLQMLRVTSPFNSYAGGTIIGSTISNRETGFGSESTYYAVEVAPTSSLGTGPVLVESNALLRILADNNLNTNAYLNIQGLVYVASNVTVPVTELTLGSNIFRSGTFSRTNGNGYISGEGMIHVVSSGRDAPAIESIHREPGDRVVVRFKADPFRSYILETTDSLSHPAWIGAATIPAALFPRTVAMTNSLQLQDPARFFRVRSGPVDEK